MIADALAHAYALIDDKRVVEAVHWLEAALAALTPIEDSSEPITPDIWAIQTVLAALHDSLGRTESARRLALLAHRYAMRTGNENAVARARARVTRLLGTPQARFARGSVPAPCSPRSLAAATPLAIPGRRGAPRRSRSGIP